MIYWKMLSIAVDDFEKEQAEQKNLTEINLALNSDRKTLKIQLGH